MMPSTNQQQERRPTQPRSADPAAIAAAEALLVSWWSLDNKTPSDWVLTACWCFGACRLADKLGMFEQADDFWLAGRVASGRATLWECV